MNVVDHKCPNCDSALNFNPKKQIWYCDYCHKAYSLKDLEHNIHKFEKTKTNKLDEYECPNCGAKVLTTDTTSSMTCLYCGNSIIIKKRIIEDYHPDFIIPFRHDKNDIVNTLLNYASSLKYCPKDFINNDNIIKVERLYVPYWLISCEVMASVKGLFEYDSDGATSYKDYRRLGTMKLNSIPIKAKSNIPEKLLRGIEPFYFQDAQKFEYPYLAGIWAESYDVTKDDVEKSEIKQIIEDVICDKLMRSVVPFTQDYLPMNKSIYKSKYDFDYILLPVWFIVIKYKNKNYYYCINDQTGKINGEYPVNNKKLSNILIIITCVLMAFTVISYVNTLDIRALIFGVLGTMAVVFLYNKSISEKYNNQRPTLTVKDYIEQAEVKIIDSEDLTY